MDEVQEEGRRSSTNLAESQKWILVRERRRVHSLRNRLLLEEGENPFIKPTLFLLLSPGRSRMNCRERVHRKDAVDPPRLVRDYDHFRTPKTFSTI